MLAKKKTNKSFGLKEFLMKHLKHVFGWITGEKITTPLQKEEVAVVKTNLSLLMCEEIKLDQANI